MGAKVAKPSIPAFLHNADGDSVEYRNISIIANPFGGGGMGGKTSRRVADILQVGSGELTVASVLILSGTGLFISGKGIRRNHASHNSYWPRDRACCKS